MARLGDDIAVQPRDATAADAALIDAIRFAARRKDQPWLNKLAWAWVEVLLTILPAEFAREGKLAQSAPEGSKNGANPL